MGNSPLTRRRFSRSDDNFLPFDTDGVLRRLAARISLIDAADEKSEAKDVSGDDC